MKKLLVSAVLCAFTLSNLYAQTKTYGTPTKSIQNAKLLNQVPTTPPPPPPPATTKTAAPVSKTEVPTSVYSLTAVKVNIRTGNDNKEFPSEVGVMLRNRGCDNGGWIMQQLPENMRNEMKSNTNTEFGLENMTNPSTQCRTLETIQNAGLQLRIYYSPNLFTDAWKIEGVSITLEFRDQNGLLHPTLGSKTIVCNNASGFLDGSNHILMCTIGGQFVPTTSSITP
jgi:hypothetical protein